MSVFKSLDDWLADQEHNEFGSVCTAWNDQMAAAPADAYANVFSAKTGIPAVEHDPVASDSARTGEPWSFSAAWENQAAAAPADAYANVFSAKTGVPAVEHDIVVSDEIIAAADKAHLDRNQWNMIEVPDYLPFSEPTAADYGNVFSAKTGTPNTEDFPYTIHDTNYDATLVRDGPVTEALLWFRDFHQVDTNNDGIPDATAIGYRAEVPDDVWESLKNNPDYVSAFEAINEKYGCDADIEASRPGFEAYYNPATRELERVESFNYVANDPVDHSCMDVRPHLDNPSYHSPPVEYSPPQPSYEAPSPSYDPPSSGFDSGGGGSSSSPD